MWPTIFGLKTYSFIYGLSIFVYVVIGIWYCRRRTYPLRIAFALSFSYLFGMTVGAKILYDILHAQFPSNYLEIGHYLKGGLWGGPLAYLALAVPMVLLFNRDKRDLLDLVVLTLPIPMIVAKVACFCNGCCYGMACDWPWAVAFPEGAVAPAGVARHLTQLYEMIPLFLVLFLFRALDRQRWKGTLLLWFVAIYGIGRPITELFRDPEISAKRQHFGPFTDSQAVCLVAALLSIAGLAFFYRYKNKRGSATHFEFQHTD